MSRQDPFDGIGNWLDRVDREFTSGAQTDDSEGSATAPWDGDVPSADVVERGEEFVVTVDLPGFAPEAVSARVNGRVVYVDARRALVAEETDEQYVRSERHRRSISRRIRLPEPVDGPALDATMTNGLLTLTVPKVTDSEKPESDAS